MIEILPVPVYNKAGVMEGKRTFAPLGTDREDFFVKNQER